MRWLQVLVQAIRPGDVIILDHSDLEVVVEVLPEELLAQIQVFTEDSVTRGTVEFNLIVDHEEEWGIGTQVHDPIGPDDRVFDCRAQPGGSFADWLTGMGDPLAALRSEGEDTAPSPEIFISGVAPERTRGAIATALEEYVERHGVESGPTIERPQVEVERVAHAKAALEELSASE